MKTLILLGLIIISTTVLGETYQGTDSYGRDCLISYSEKIGGIKLVKIETNFLTSQHIIHSFLSKKIYTNSFDFYRTDSTTVLRTVDSLTLRVENKKPISAVITRTNSIKEKGFDNILNEYEPTHQYGGNKKETCNIQQE